MAQSKSSYLHYYYSVAGATAFSSLTRVFASMIAARAFLSGGDFVGAWVKLYDPYL
jgi:hypothetical protein